MHRLPTLTHPAARRAQRRIAADAVAPHDVQTLLQRALAALADAVRFDAAGLSTVDPDTLLWTGGTVCGLPPETGAQFVDLELLHDDAMTFRSLIASGRRTGILSEATGGDLERSRRYREMYAPNGMAHELRVALVADGRCYGTGCLLRAGEAPDFTAREAGFVAEAGRHVAEGLRTGLARALVERPDAVERPGVLVVDDDARILSVSDEAASWLEELAPGGFRGERAPVAVQAVVARARRRAEGHAGPSPQVRVSTPSGRWLAVHASVLSGDSRAWAVVLEAARPSEVLPLVGAGHDLTAREQEVLALLLRGVPDKGIAQELWLSPHTARDHARRVLRKFGVRSRAELQALLYEQHYEPRSDVCAMAVPA